MQFDRRGGCLTDVGVFHESIEGGCASCSHRIDPNQFVTARLLVDTRRDAVVVPSAAVRRGPTSMFVCVVKVVDKEATAEFRVAHHESSKRNALPCRDWTCDMI